MLATASQQTAPLDKADRRRVEDKPLVVGEVVFAGMVARLIQAVSEVASCFEPAPYLQPRKRQAVWLQQGIRVFGEANECAWVDLVHGPGCLPISHPQNESLAESSTKLWQWT